MSFNTTFTVNPGIALLGHPSMFQTPDIDHWLKEHRSQLKTLRPVEMWQNRVSIPSESKKFGNMQSHYQVPKDPNDPPLNTFEKQTLITKFRPVLDKSFYNRQPSLLFYLFFSQENCNVLQANIRYAVNKWSGFHVGEQSVTELVRTMYDVFSTYARHIDEFHAPSKILFTHLRDETRRLNELVVNIATPIVVNGVEQHMAYLKKVETPFSYDSLERPKDANIAGTKSYRSPTDIVTIM
jgi:hypothetical protein